jgi:hypothetical protein
VPCWYFLRRARCQDGVGLRGMPCRQLLPRCKHGTDSLPEWNLLRAAAGAGGSADPRCGSACGLSSWNLLPIWISSGRACACELLPTQLAPRLLPGLPQRHVLPGGVRRSNSMPSWTCRHKPLLERRRGVGLRRLRSWVPLASRLEHVRGLCTWIRMHEYFGIAVEALGGAS